MSINKQFFPTRKERKALGANHTVPRSDVKGGCEIFNPTADRIERGMMIRVWNGKSPLTRKTFFDTTIIESVNVEENTVSVRCSVGGTREHTRTHNVTDIECVWAIGGYDHAINLINAFNGRVRQASQQAEELLNK